MSQKIARQGIFYFFACSKEVKGGGAVAERPVNVYPGRQNSKYTIAYYRYVSNRLREWIDAVFRYGCTTVFL